VHIPDKASGVYCALAVKGNPETIMNGYGLGMVFIFENSHRSCQLFGNVDRSHPNKRQAPDATTLNFTS